MRKIFCVVFLLFGFSLAGNAPKIETLIQQPSKVQNFRSDYSGIGKRFFRFQLIGTVGDFVDAGVEVQAKAENKPLFMFTLGADGMLSSSVMDNWAGLQRYLAQFCLGLTQANAEAIQKWALETRAKISKTGQGKFVKQFGDTNVQFSSSFFVDKTSSIHIKYSRNAVIGSSKWQYFCIFD